MSKNYKFNKSEESNNVYASNVRGETIHISQANSGRQGYYCLGCGKEMQAMIARVDNRISFFRHDPEAVRNLGKCNYSDETLRHKLAKGMLQDLKRIKVPSLYKYPSKGVEGKANFIEEEKFISAAKVKLEVSFFEDENGEIHFGKGTGVNDKHLLIRPDVTFFDKDNNPILFIELVATHKVTNEKIIKIKHLGVDTVQVSIPKGAPDEIEKALLTSSRTKWIYNYEQEQREYLPVSEGTSEEVLPIDEEQRKLFEETFACRQSEIRGLIRQFRKCLESEPYRNADHRIRAEIQKVEDATKRAEKKLAKLRSGAIRAAEKSIESGRTNFEIKRKKNQDYSFDLERRYHSKKAELEETENNLREEETNLESEYHSKREILIESRDRFDQEQNGIEQRRKEISTEVNNGFRESAEEFERYYQREVEETEITRTNIKKLKESNGQIRADLRSRIQEVLREDADSYRFEKVGIEEDKSQTRIKIKHTTQEIRKEQIRQGEIRAGIREKYFKIGNSLEQGELKASSFRFTNNFRKFKEAITIGGAFHNLEKAIFSEDYYRRAIKSIDSKAFLNWND